jgi:soluble lytic murein transglycosylase-like protein
MRCFRCMILAAVLGALLGGAPARASEAIGEFNAEQAMRQLLRAEGQAYENGEGVERDPERAAQAYCRAARLGDAQSQFNLGWMYANGRGVQRSDSAAAFFFHAAAEQGWEQAQRMLDSVGGAPNFVPECMLDGPKPGQTRQTAAAVQRSTQTALADIDARIAKIQADARTSAAMAAISGPPHLVSLVKQIAPEYQLKPQLVLAIIQTESNFNTVAVSPKNAKGLMQLIPETAARFGVRNPYDPAQNIRGGMAYLRWLLAHFEGDVTLVAAAYNAGEGAVNRYRGVPPYAETRAYVRKVLNLAGLLSHPFDARVTTPSSRF